MEIKDTSKSKSKDPQGRKWLITENYQNRTPPSIEELTTQIGYNSFIYSCFAFEKGKEGTIHVHIYIYFKTPRRFSTLKTAFPKAHLDRVEGTHEEVRDYIRKSGKWEGTDKSETSIPGTFSELGTFPTSSESQSTSKQQKLYDDIMSGKTTAEIVKDDPSYLTRVGKINEAREELLYAPFKSKYRDVKVIYIYGATNTGKTRGIFDKYPPEDICRITKYKSNSLFDGYQGHSVLVFEEYRSQIKIAEMLNYLDVYPISLPARYFDRHACYSSVFITSNIPLELQYPDIQFNEPETWLAFLRRISHVRHYNKDGSIEDYAVSLDRNGEIHFDVLLSPGVSDAPNAWNRNNLATTPDMEDMDTTDEDIFTAYTFFDYAKENGIDLNYTTPEIIEEGGGRENE